MELSESQESSENNCIICDNENFQTVLNSGGVNMTSDSRLMNMPLIKEQCEKCGYVRSANFSEFTLPQFYEQNYTLAEDQFDAVPKHFTEVGVISKFESQAKWVIKNLPKNYSPKKCLEIGCGAGNLIEELRKFWPDCKFVGVEPSTQARYIASSKGVTVYKSTDEVSEVDFDLSISFAVIEHLAEPWLLFDLKNSLKDSGFVVIVQPIQEGESHDIFFLDHLHHFCVSHVNKLAEKHGYETINVSSDVNNLGFSMQMYKKRKINQSESITVPFENSAKQIEPWLKRFHQINIFLNEMTGHEMSILGVGETFILAYANCPGLRKLKLHFFDENFKRSERLLKQIGIEQKVEQISKMKAKLPTLLTFRPSEHLKLKLKRSGITFREIRS